MASSGWLLAVKVVVVVLRLKAVDYNSFSRQQRSENNSDR